MSWTEQQEAAITARGASLVLSAAAGSGKTAVLVERLIRLLSDDTDKLPAEQLVVVTFTNDAAAEVRARLYQALDLQMAQHPENDWLRRQQTMLQSAHIATIHSFCFDLLREQFAAAGISAGFRIMDEKEEAMLRSETAAAVLEHYSREAAENAEIAAQQQLLLDAFCTGSDEELEELIQKLYKCIESAPFGETLLWDAADACQDGRMQAAAMRQIAEQIEEAALLQEKALAILLPLDAPKQTAVLTDEITLTDRLRGAVEAGDLAQLDAILSSMKFATLSNLKKPDFAQVRALRNRAKTLLNDLQKWQLPLRYADADLPRHAALLRALAYLLEQFDAELFAAKQERCAIGFADAMRLTLRLLAERTDTGEIHKTPLAEQLSAQYACIMIDEFQDADNQQDLIFRMLSRGGDVKHYGSNLFVVGDSKQCIYRFRNANPQNFYRAMRESAPYTTPVLTENTCIHLNRNFRSAEEVIGFVNAIFRPLMTEKVGEVCYDDSQQLVQGMDYPPQDRAVEVMLLSGANAIQADEPRAVAERIAWHLAQGTPVTDRGGATRPCRPKDFLILLRTSTHMEDYANALKDAGVPVCPIPQSSYLGSQEIMLLLDILRAVDNPLLDISVAAALVSPLFAFSVDDLIAVRLAKRGSSLYQGVQELMAAEDTAEPLRKKCKDFLDFLESMRLFSAMETPEQLIRRIYQQTDFLGLMQLHEHGQQRKANLRALTGYAKQFEENRGGGLSAFLRYVDAILSRKSDLSAGNTPAVSEDVVMLKTIHKSKGLEAPFVILAHTDDGFSNEDSKQNFLFHADLGFGFRLHDPAELTYDHTLPFVTILRQNKREARSEELRLLYVALTRAREKLILPLVFGNKYAQNAEAYAAEQTAFGGQTPQLTAAAGCMRDWLVMALIRNPACEQLRQTLGIDCGTDAHALPISTVVTEYAPAKDEAQKTDASAEESEQNCDEALVQRLKALCLWQYGSPQTDLPAKYGVSEIAHGDDFSTPLRRPLFVRERHGLSGAERGTALHTFMQYANFQAATENLEAETDRLMQAGKLTQRQGKAVKSSEIAKFFESPLCKRILAADSVSREEKFTVRLADLELDGPLEELGRQYEGTAGMLIGIMDLVFEENGKTVLLDYKTDHVSDASALLERYTEQIRLYAKALCLLRGKPVSECLIYSFALQRTIPVPL